jgi:hypothetical protein
MIKQLGPAAFITTVLGAALLAQQPGQRTFPSAEEASRAYFEAAQRDDDKGLVDILGPASKDLVFSGDSSEDENSRIEFVVKYLEKHRLETGPDATAVLYIGAEEWRMPIPLAGKSGVWYFDTQSGKNEILSQRIAKDEQVAARACRELFDAQNLYYMLGHQSDSVHQFALRFVSQEDDHTGLFWQNAIDEFDSPLDPRIASAGVEPALKGEPKDPLPFHGYFFRMLMAQGGYAHGGAKNYIVNGQMTGGFAFLAYPAKYGSTGVMTFIISQDGTVYRKDLGPDTARVAKAATEYDPDSSWEIVPSSTDRSQAGDLR